MTTTTVMREAYDRHFTRHKRQPTRALGWPATCWLLDALDQWEAMTVLECGSGWSTTALRMWAAARPGRAVVTTDHKRPWLDLARRECELEGLDVSGFAEHDAYLSLPLRRFDAVLADLADLKTRAARMGEFVARVRPGGWLILDDWHEPDYVHAASAWFRAAGHDTPTPVLASVDEWSRFLAVWLCPEVS
jgi:SAM-dependent methyltransferase